jgi:hypothetical protein
MKGNSWSRELIAQIETACGDPTLKVRTNKSGQIVLNSSCRYVVNGILFERRSMSSSVYLRHFFFPLTSLTFNVTMDYGRRIMPVAVEDLDSKFISNVIQNLALQERHKHIFIEPPPSEFLNFLVEFQQSHPKKAPQKEIDIAIFTAMTGDVDRARAMLCPLNDAITWHENRFKEYRRRFKSALLIRRSEERMKQVDLLRIFIAGHAEIDEYLTASVSINKALIGF